MSYHAMVGSFHDIIYLKKVMPLNVTMLQNLKDILTREQKCIILQYTSHRCVSHSGFFSG